MTDVPQPGRQPQADVLMPEDAALAARLRDFAEAGVRPFDIAGIVAIATVGPASGAPMAGGRPRASWWPNRSAWILIGIVLAAVLATVMVVVGSQRLRPSFVQTPRVPPTTVPSQLAVVASGTPDPS